MNPVLENGHEYIAIEPSPRHICQRRAAAVASVALFGIAVGACSIQVWHRLAPADLPSSTAHQHKSLTPRLASLPTPCIGWLPRCQLGANAADVQGFARFWPASICNEKASCESRAHAWTTPSVAQPPSRREQHAPGDQAVTDKLADDTLFVFLAGTGTSTSSVHSLLDAASDMGYHAIGLAYASLPIAVSMISIWCTRPGVDATECNVALHEAVLFGASAEAGASPDGAAGALWDVPTNESVSSLLASGLRELRWTQFLSADATEVRWDRVVVAGHSQGASHAAYLSVARRVRAALLFSGPQEVPACAGWLGWGAPTLRRAVYALREECGDEPEARSSFCALHPRLLRTNLGRMGLTPGVIGNQSGFVVVDFQPLTNEGRSHHDAVALQDKTPAPTEALWKALLARL